MIYRFSDIHNEKMYDTTQVMFIAGNLDIFNNMINDRLKDSCRGEMEDIDIPTELMSEFGIEDTDSEVGSTLNSVDIDSYFDLCNTPSVIGKWFCSESYEDLSKKQRERLEKFIRTPSENGVLVIRVADFRDIKGLLGNKVIKNSGVVNLIRVSFPNKVTLRKIVLELFNKHEVSVEEKAIDLFILRVSDQYNEYQSLVEKIALNCKGTVVDYSTMAEQLKGVENYVIDDFIEELASKPIGRREISVNRKIYKIERALLNEYKPADILRQLYKKIDNIIEMRVMINKGAVPSMVKFKVETAQTRIGEGSRLSKLSEYGFMKLYKQAQLTSLKDWVFIKLILSSLYDNDKPKYMISESEYYKVLHAIINRTTFSNYRLLNDMHIEDVSRVYIDKLDKYLYEDRENGVDSMGMDEPEGIDESEGIEEPEGIANVNAELDMERLMALDLRNTLKHLSEDNINT